jgi:hypothetical protein
MKTEEFYDENNKFKDSIVALYKEEIVELMNDFIKLKENELKEKLNSQEFYELMQSYRHSPKGHQERVIETFDAVKEFVLEETKDV